MKPNRIILITAGLFVLFGAIIAGVSVMLLGNSSLQNERMQTQVITENISKINVSADMSDVKILTDDTDNITLTYFTDETNQYDITTENGTLSIEYVRFKNNKIKWYDYYLNFDFNRNHEIIIKVPKSFGAGIQLKNDYGDIEVQNIQGGNMTVYNDCGDIKILNCKFTTVEFSANYGDIKTYNINCESMSAQSDCGDIEISGCKFTALECNTNYGDIDIDRCESETLNCSSDCGDINIENISGNNISLYADYGDIEGTILGSEEDYSINAETNLGKKNIQNKPGIKKSLNVKTYLGDISLEFIE